MALKKSFDNDGWVMRFFEATDQDRQAHLSLHPALGLQNASFHSANMLEKAGDPIPKGQGDVALALRGFEVRTLRID